MVADCPTLAVPLEIMASIVKVESAFNPYAIGVVGNRLQRQPKNIEEAVATAEDLEKNGYNFSLGLAQVNKYNLKKYGLNSYKEAFDGCNNIVAGSKILNECYGRSGSNWGKAFSCYYSGNFTVGYKHGYVQKVAAHLPDYFENNKDKKNTAGEINDTESNTGKAIKLTNSYRLNPNIKEQLDLNKTILPRALVSQDQTTKSTNSEIDNKFNKINPQSIQNKRVVQSSYINNNINMKGDTAFIF
jgi:Transglycosylase SLT domain